MANSLHPLSRVDRITYDELARDLRLHYETTGTLDLRKQAPENSPPLFAC